MTEKQVSELPEGTVPPFELSPETTIGDLTHAYINAVLDEEKFANPIFETVALIHEKGWLRIRFDVSHTWTHELPEDAKQAMLNSGKEIPDAARAVEKP